MLNVSIEDLEGTVGITCSATFMGTVEGTTIVITAYCEQHTHTQHTLFHFESKFNKDLNIYRGMHVEEHVVQFS